MVDMKLYGKKYSEAWINNYESKGDEFRVKFLEPYLKKYFKNFSKGSSILDVGCGWGVVLKFLDKSSNYTGVDISKHFLDYVKKRFNQRNIKLMIGNLPNNINCDGFFDIVVCSMVLHTVRELDSSVKILFEKAKPSGKILIIDFNDSAKDYIKKKGFLSVEDKNKEYIRGTYLLPSGIIVPAEVYLHKEKDYEREIQKYGKFSKKEVGPLFTSWECKKFK